jgi:MFS family permease
MASDLSVRNTVGEGSPDAGAPSPERRTGPPSHPVRPVPPRGYHAMPSRARRRAVAPSRGRHVLVAPAGAHAFAALWWATAASNLGDGVILAAAPLAAASLTSDPRLVAGMTVAATLPWALFCLISGAVVDRVDRIRLMWRIDLLRACVIAVPALLFALGSPNIYVLFVVFFALGTAETFYANAAQAALPSVVPASRLQSANGKLQSAELILNQLVGPPLGSLLFGLAVALPFAVDSASFLMSAALLLLIPRRREPVAPRPVVREPLRRQVAEGLWWLWNNHQLRVLAMFTGLVNLLTEATLSVLVIFSREDLGAGDVGFGYLLALAALGGVVASGVGPALISRLGNRRTLIAVLVIQSVTQLAIFWSSSFAVIAGALAFAAGGIIVWNIVTISLRQTVVPDRLLGRVNSVYRFVAWGTIPLGAGAGGVIAAAIGTRSLFLVSGLLLAGVAVLAVFLLSPSPGETSSSQ